MCLSKLIKKKRTDGRADRQRNGHTNIDGETDKGIDGWTDKSLIEMRESI